MSKIRWPRFNKADLAISDKAFVLFNIELTNRCPFKCVMCARTHSMTRAQGDMTFDMFSRAIDVLIPTQAAHDYEMMSPGCNGMMPPTKTR